MKLDELLLTIADCTVVIHLTDKNGRTICYKQKRDFSSNCGDFEVNYIDLYYDLAIDHAAFEININYDLLRCPDAKEFK